MKISDVLRKAIREAGVSAYAVAQGSGIPQPTITRFLNGAEMKSSTIDKLAEFLGLELVSSDQLASQKPAKTELKKPRHIKVAKSEEDLDFLRETAANRIDSGFISRSFTYSANELFARGFGLIDIQHAIDSGIVTPRQVGNMQLFLGSELYDWIMTLPTTGKDRPSQNPKTKAKKPPAK